MEGVCTENGRFYLQSWKYFRELGEGEVLTLNQETLASEWQKPKGRIASDYSGDLYEIVIANKGKVNGTPFIEIRSR